MFPHILKFILPLIYIFGFALTLQKEVQRGEEAQIHLHDMICLWLWMKKKMKESFPGEVLDRHQTLFDNGILD